MKTVYLALELGEETISTSEIARLAGAKDNNVSILPMQKCIDKNRRFRQLTDIYLWTCKYWYGLHEERLTFVRIKGIDKLNPFLTLSISSSLRFAIAARNVDIFSNALEINSFSKAIHASHHLFNDERISEIKPHLSGFESAYKILFLSNNPFA